MARGLFSSRPCARARSENPSCRVLAPPSWLRSRPSVAACPPLPPGHPWPAGVLAGSGRSLTLREGGFAPSGPPGPPRSRRSLAFVARSLRVPSWAFHGPSRPATRRLRARRSYGLPSATKRPTRKSVAAAKRRAPPGSAPRRPRGAPAAPRSIAAGGSAGTARSARCRPPKPSLKKSSAPPLPPRPPPAPPQRLRRTTSTSSPWGGGGKGGRGGKKSEARRGRRTRPSGLRSTPTRTTRRELSDSL